MDLPLGASTLIVRIYFIVQSRQIQFIRSQDPVPKHAPTEWIVVWYGYPSVLRVLFNINELDCLEEFIIDVCPRSLITPTDTNHTKNSAAALVALTVFLILLVIIGSAFDGQNDWSKSACITKHSIDGLVHINDSFIIFRQKIADSRQQTLHNRAVETIEI